MERSEVRFQKSTTVGEQPRLEITRRFDAEINMV